MTELRKLLKQLCIEENIPMAKLAVKLGYGYNSGARLGDSLTPRLKGRLLLKYRKNSLVNNFFNPKSTYFTTLAELSHYCADTITEDVGEVKIRIRLLGNDVLLQDMTIVIQGAETFNAVEDFMQDLEYVYSCQYKETSFIITTL